MLCSDAVKLGCCVDAVTTEMLAESIIHHIRNIILFPISRGKWQVAEQEHRVGAAS